MRDKSGRFVKGYSGNAGGRPKDEHNALMMMGLTIAVCVRFWLL